MERYSLHFTLSIFINLRQLIYIVYKIQWYIMRVRTQTTYSDYVPRLCTQTTYPHYVPRLRTQTTYPNPLHISRENGSCEAAAPDPLGYGWWNLIYVWKWGLVGSGSQWLADRVSGWQVISRFHITLCMSKITKMKHDKKQIHGGRHDCGVSIWYQYIDKHHAIEGSQATRRLDYRLSLVLFLFFLFSIALFI